MAASGNRFQRTGESEQCRSAILCLLLWEEYRAANPDGYGYSRFCYRYQRWKCERNLVLRLKHRLGEKLFVDWAGAIIPVYDPETG
jgi:transposase